MRIIRPVLLALSLIVLPPGYANASDGKSHTDPLIGKHPPEWQVSDWLNSDPASLGALRGKVVFVRWWTAGCMLCASSTESLNLLQQRFQSQDFFVAAFYHHKSEEPLDVEAVHDYARRYEYKFPVAIDHDWHTLNTWWLDGKDREYTSVSFLLDRNGTIRYVHKGGQLSRLGGELEIITRLIQQLLAEENQGTAND